MGAKTRWAGLFVTMSLALVACAYPKAGPAPSALSPNAVAAAHARWPDQPEAALQEGREVFIAKCNGCHDYPDITNITEERWPDVVKRMSEKAKLTPGESEEVLHFILVAREDRAQVEPPH